MMTMMKARIARVPTICQVIYICSSHVNSHKFAGEKA